jgi:hypothetical protein
VYGVGVGVAQRRLDGWAWGKLGLSVVELSCEDRYGFFDVWDCGVRHMGWGCCNAELSLCAARERVKVSSKLSARFGIITA